MPNSGFNANWRNSGAPGQVLLEDGDSRGNGNPYQVGPPPLQPILSIDCGMTVSAAITSGSPASLFRTGDPITNQSYRARIIQVIIEAWEDSSPKHVKFTVTPTGFDVFLAVVRDQDHSWYSSDGSGVVEFDVDQNTEGPFLVEISTLSAGQTGSFTIKQDCAGYNMHWSFENSSSVDDDIMQVHLAPFNFTFMAGFIGQGIDINGGAFGPLAQMLGALDPVTSPQLALYKGGGISCAWWVKFHDAGIGFPAVLAQLTYNGDDGHVYQLDFLVGGDIAGPGLSNPGALIAQDPITPGPRVITMTVPITFSIGPWYFVVLTYDNVTHKLKVSINNAAYVSSSSSFTLPTGTWSFFQLSAGQLNPNLELDEYLVTTNYALTANDINFLYNGGAGVAWPYDIPTPSP